MTRETKVGLLIGMGVILLIGIIVSDTLSVARQGPADLVEHGDRSQDSIFRPGPGSGSDNVFAEQDSSRDGRPLRQTRREPLPTPEDAEARRRRALAEQERDGVRSRSSQRQLPTALALDGGQADRYDASDVPSISLSHDAIFYTPDRPTAVDQPVQSTEPRERPASQRMVRQPAPAASSEPMVIERTSSSRRRATTHTVQRGETLTAIASRYYDSGTYWRRLAEANPDLVGPDGQVTAGTELVIPDRETLTLRDAGFERVGSERVVRIADAPSASPASASAPAREITVGSGDTLSALAAEHLGSATRWRELLDANRDQLDSDTALRAGMTLKLPGGTTASRSSQHSTGSARSAAATRSYTVRSGDSLTRIAQRELGDGGRWRDVFDANRDQLASPDSLRVGQTLRLP